LEDMEYERSFSNRARVFLSIGSNLSDRAEKIQRAINLLNHNKIKVTRISPIYQTEPTGLLSIFGIGLPVNKVQHDFLNCVVEAFTGDEPEQLIVKILKIENALGRKRISHIRNLPRTIDIDILFYDNLIINLKTLSIPHPRLQERAFVLIPLCDLEPDFIHPALNRTIKELANLVDRKGVRPWGANLIMASV